MFRETLLVLALFAVVTTSSCQNTQKGIASGAMMQPVMPPNGLSNQRALPQAKPRRLSVASKLPADLTPKDIQTTTSAHYQVSYMESLNTVIQEIDAIVVGKPTQDFIPREHRTEYVNGVSGDYPSQRVSSRWSRGPFLISRVLQKKTSINLLAGQTISVAEPVGLDYDADLGAFKSIAEKCYELKENSEYVLFIGRGTDGTYGTDNLNNGRFNTDGTDCEDELEANNGRYSGSTIKTPKQILREELTARYGITFAPIAPCTSAQPRITASKVSRQRLDGLNTVVTVRITPPQPGNSILQVEHSVNSTGAWTQIVNAPVIDSARSGTADVYQSTNILQLYPWVRYRIVNGTPSAWSEPVKVEPRLML